ncbi:MAG: DUF3108 domain-containing protein [Bacteroidales bacterium]|nr:DUF3108 domain-containing protein [Bacteroidales bacterium]
MLWKRLIFLILFFYQGFVHAQNSESWPFLSGETVSYKVYYNLAWVWVEAANVEFSINDTVFQNKPVVLLRSYGASKPSYDWIFRVRDYFTSIIDPYNFQSYYYRRKTSEGSHKVDNRYYFSNSNKSIYSFINDNEKEPLNDTLKYTSNKVLDVLSAVYYLRTLDYSNDYKVGDVIPIHTVMDNELILINVTYEGKTTVTMKDGTVLPAFKLKSKGVAGSIFDEDSEIHVWVSRDRNKIPLKIESEILVGTVKAFLVSVRKPNEKESKVIAPFFK